MRSAADLEDLCRYSACVEDAFAGLTERRSGLSTSERTVSEDEARDGLTTDDGHREILRADVGSLPLPESVDRRGPSGEDPLIRAFHARSYARERARRLLQSYDIIVPSSVAPVFRYDEELGTLTAVFGDQIEVTGGSFALVPGDGASLQFPIGAGAAEELIALHQMGSLQLRVTFMPAVREDPWSEFCTVDDGVTRVGVELIAAEIVEARSLTPRARAETEEYAEEALRRSAAISGLVPVGGPIVDVSMVEIRGATDCTDFGSLLSAVVETVLLSCYVAGLDSNAGLRGVLVFDFDVASDGRITRPTVAIDAFASATVSDCSLATLDRTTLHCLPTDDVSVRMTTRYSYRSE